MSNASRTAELRSQLDALKVDDLSASTLGHAAYAWMTEAKMADPFSTADAASQMVGLLRNGKTLGEKTQERLRPFLDMLAESDKPRETAVEWSQRNGHAPTRPGLGGGLLSEEEEITVYNIPEHMRPLLEPIVEQYKVAQAEVEKRRTYFEEARSEAAILLNMLKAAGVVEREKRTKREEKPKPRQARGSHISEESAMKILEDIRGYLANGHPPTLPDVPGSFTRPELERALGLHHSKITAAVERLREMGQVRAAGVVASPSGQKVNVFAVA